MFGSEILEVAIGIIFVFLLVSVICSAVREGIEGWLKTRAAFLEHGIRELLHDRGAVGIARTLYTHPLIYGLYAGTYTPRSTGGRLSAFARGGDLPSYIPSRNFALALLDIAARGPGNQAGATDATSPFLGLHAARANVLNIENASVQRILLTAIDTAQGDIDKAVANIAAWYDSGMDRVSGAYKRATQKVLFVIGLVIAIGLNVNAITIADYLYRNDAARAAVVAHAEAAARDSTFVKQGDPTNYLAARAELDSLRIPIGWSTGWGAPRQAPDPEARGVWNNGFAPFIGWLLVAFAATFGAPFWFDLLNKVMVIRSTVKPHEKSPEESSEDRQSRADRTAVMTPVGGSATQPAGTGAGAAAAPGVPVPAPAPPPDPEGHVDGCDVEAGDITLDEELPPARGGVA